ncbi:MAG: hypothetical protein ACYSUY_06820 [Planctomycetota bacterium]
MKKKKSKAMDSQDVDKIGHKAKCETEAFINSHINDRAKGWPVIRPCGSVNTGYRREKHVKRPGVLPILLTK